jgi:hypothetical protein
LRIASVFNPAIGNNIKTEKLPDDAAQSGINNKQLHNNQYTPCLLLHLVLPLAAW